MDELPIELYRFLFGYFELNDLLKMRLLCKKMNEVVNEIGIEELIINQRNLHYGFMLKDNWYFKNKSINFKNLISNLKPSILTHSSFSRLKCLRIGNVSGNDKIRLKDLNRLSLVQLEIHYDKCSIDSKLSILNLKILVIKSSIQIRMEIDCPNLRKLSLDYGTFDLIKFNNLASINHFKTNNYDVNVQKFKNLIYFECNTATNLEEDILINLPSLSVLKINSYCFNAFQVLMNILESHLKNQEFKLLYKGVLVSSKEQLSEIDFNQNQLSFQIENYSKLHDNLNEMTFIPYGYLISLTNQFTPDFFKKYSNIQIIELKNVIQDQDCFLKFIRNCKNLYELILIKTKFDQTFYSQLVKMKLIILRIFEDDQTFKLDFNFIINMNNLEQLITDLALEHCLGVNLIVNKFKNLKEFTFLLRNERIHFSKLDNYEIKFKKIKKQNLNLNEAIEWCNQFIEDSD